MENIYIISLVIIGLMLVYVVYNLIKWDIYINMMSPRRFEKYVKKLFEKQGYDCKLTKATGDQGVDIIAKRFLLNTAIQVKKYRKKVSNTAVQQVVAGKKYYNLNRAAVVTSSYFTQSAVALAEANKVWLIDRKELKQLHQKFMTKNRRPR